MAFKKRTVVAHAHLPISLRLDGWFCIFTCMHYWNAPGWLYGAVGLVCVFAVVAAGIDIALREDREPTWGPS